MHLAEDIARQLTRADMAAPSARLAGLHYANDQVPGYRRVARGKGFVYFNGSRRPIRKAETLSRISALAIPPAWTDVWICPSADGHLQATGRDVRGRKQYRYHNDWRITRDLLKYDRMLAFAKCLPKIRRKLARDIRQTGLTRDRVLATLVRLLDRTLLRVGNDEYVAANGSFGLTTIHNRHAAVKGDEIAFNFRGKSGKQRGVRLRDQRLASIVRRCQDLPGQDLFAYLDESGEVRDVTSQEVNAYLRDASGQDFSAKDFRTWHATTLAIDNLRDCPQARSATAARRQINAALDCVAEQLGNTRAVCRKSYVHPGVLAAFEQGEFKPPRQAAPKRGLSVSETRALAVLRRLARSVAKRKPAAKPAGLKASLARSLRLAPVPRRDKAPRGKRARGQGARRAS